MSSSQSRSSGVWGIGACARAGGGAVCGASIAWRAQRADPTWEPLKQSRGNPVAPLVRADPAVLERPSMVAEIAEALGLRHGWVTKCRR